jgi:hypothetical protein
MWTAVCVLAATGACAGSNVTPGGSGGSSPDGSTATGGSNGGGGGGSGGGNGGQSGAGGAIAAGDGGADRQSPLPDGGTKLNDICDGVPGLTGQEVVDAVKYFKPQTGRFSRYKYPPGPPVLELPTTVTLSAHYEGGEVRCTPSRPDPPGTPNPGIRPAILEVIVQLEFVTADGLFNESVAVPFERTGGSRLHFGGTVPVSSIKGTYRAIAEGDAAGSGEPVLFYGLYDPLGPPGSYGGVAHGQAFGYFKYE